MSVHMRMTFLGTRGNIDARSRRHWRHTSTLVTHGRTRVMIDCGEDWLRHVGRLKPGAILLTHAHPDHVGGLRNGAPCAVYATEDAWQQIENWPIDERFVVRPDEPIDIAGIVFEPLRVQHSIRAPAVAYRIRRRRSAVVFYVPDVLDIRGRHRALADVGVYVGDGASLDRPIQRERNGMLTGHASIATQIQWCADAGIHRAIFTHCGTGLVTGGAEAERAVRVLGDSRGVRAQVACDGLQVAFA